MRYIYRAAWGARPAARGGNVLSRDVHGTGIHWYGGGVGRHVRTHDECAALVRQTQAAHMSSNGWADVAYTDLVCPHGYIFEGRGRGKGTSAFGSTFHNAHYYATCALWGEGDGPAPAAMLNGIADAVALHKEWGAGNKVISHRDTTSTECPGDEIAALVKAGRFHKRGTPSTSTPSTKPAKQPTKGISVRVIDLRNVSRTKYVQGPGVKPMQRLLNVQADGLAGLQTRHALGVAQKRAGLPIDYMFGPATATALLAGA